MIHVRLQQFEGPLDLLLQLIERQELDISTVSLAEVTDQYLGTLEQVERRNPDELADFLVVAAKLLLIKSRILLPQLNLPDEEGIPLEDQLRLYKTFVGASVVLYKLFRRRHVMYPREHTATLEPTFMPPDRLGLADLADAFRLALERLEPVTMISQTTIARTVSLQQKIESIRDLLFSQTAVNFKQLLEHAESRMDVIVTFLALLELVKQRTALVVQDENFSEIQITKTVEVITLSSVETV
jgi:segregation and condensation protein A